METVAFTYPLDARNYEVFLQAAQGPHQYETLHYYSYSLLVKLEEP